MSSSLGQAGFDVGGLGTILGVWAHPDDEAFLSAGVMAAARAADQRVVVLTATRGELGTPDPESWPLDRLGAHREVELGRSLAELGVFEHFVLGHPDGGCRAVALEQGAAEVAEVIERVEPDTILTFGRDGFTGHPDHQSVSAWVDAAAASTRSRARVLQATSSEEFLRQFEDVHRDLDVFFAGQPSVTEPTDMALDLELRGHLLDRKVAALEAQHSQTAGLVAQLGEQRFRQWIARECFVAARGV